MLKIEQLYDKKILSDFRPQKTTNGFIIRVKRSKYLTFIPSRVNADIAYLSGTIAGDGSYKVSKRKNVKYPRAVITITNKSKSFLEDLNSRLVKNFRYEGKIYKYSGKNCYDLQISNRVIFLYFRRIIGLTKDNSKVKIPKSVSTKKLLKFFIAGIFDTDGYYSRDTFGIMMTGKNYYFLKQVKKQTYQNYKLSFGKIGRNILHARDKVYERVIMRLKSDCRRQFLRTIPLRHEKYGPGRNRTGGFHRVKVAQNSNNARIL